VHGNQRYGEQKCGEQHLSHTRERLDCLVNAIEVSAHRFLDLDWMVPSSAKAIRSSMPSACPRVQLRNAYKSLSARISLTLHTHRFGREFLLRGLLIRIERNGETDREHDRDHNSDTEAAHAACAPGKEAQYARIAEASLSKYKSQ
jgi:hypothetical protein